MRVVLHKVRTTKNTVRYETDEEEAAITVLYIQQKALPNPFPDLIQVVVEAVATGDGS